MWFVLRRSLSAVLFFPTVRALSLFISVNNCILLIERLINRATWHCRQNSLCITFFLPILLIQTLVMRNGTDLLPNIIQQPTNIAIMFARICIVLSFTLALSVLNSWSSCYIFRSVCALLREPCQHMLDEKHRFLYLKLLCISTCVVP